MSQPNRSLEVIDIAKNTGRVCAPEAVAKTTVWNTGPFRCDICDSFPSDWQLRNYRSKDVCGSRGFAGRGSSAPNFGIASHPIGDLERLMATMGIAKSMFVGAGLAGRSLHTPKGSTP